MFELLEYARSTWAVLTEPDGSLASIARPASARVRAGIYTRRWTRRAGCRIAAAVGINSDVAANGAGRGRVGVLVADTAHGHQDKIVDTIKTLFALDWACRWPPEQRGLGARAPGPDRRRHLDRQGRPGERDAPPG